MFKKNEEGGTIKEVETIIGPSIKVKGNFNGQGNIVVEGTLEGGLKTKGDVFIGNQAKIIGNLEAKNLNIAGEVNGNIKSFGYLEIISSAKILGDVECAKISIEKGALLNGKCTMMAERPEITNEETKE